MTDGDQILSDKGNEVDERGGLHETIHSSYKSVPIMPCSAPISKHGNLHIDVTRESSDEEDTKPAEVFTNPRHRDLFTPHTTSVTSKTNSSEIVIQRVRMVHLSASLSTIVTVPSSSFLIVSKRSGSP